MAKRSSKRASQEEKRKKYLQWGMTIFMGFILTTSLVVFAVFNNPSSQANAQVYNDVSFRQDQNGYLTFRYEGIEHRSYALPQDVESIDVPNAFLETMDNTSRVTIARNQQSDAYLAIATQFLSESLTKTDRYAVTQAFTEGTQAVNCSEASSQNPIILFEQSNETVLTYADSCLRIEYADQTSILTTKNAVLYRVLGIIE